MDFNKHETISVQTTDRPERGRAEHGHHEQKPRERGASETARSRSNVSAWWSRCLRERSPMATTCFVYPLYITDEGIYMERAWALLREGTLSPYTYYYDHAPGGWILIAAWVVLLPHQFQALGNAINTGRVLMLLTHIASTYLLFKITRRLSGSVTAAVIACFSSICRRWPSITSARYCWII